MTGRARRSGEHDAEGTRVSKGAIQVWSCDPTAAQYVTKADYILGPGGEQMSEYRMKPGGAMRHADITTTGTYGDALMESKRKDNSMVVRRALKNNPEGTAAAGSRRPKSFESSESYFL